MRGLSSPSQWASSASLLLLIWMVGSEGLNFRHLALWWGWGIWCSVTKCCMIWSGLHFCFLLWLQLWSFSIHSCHSAEGKFPGFFMYLRWWCFRELHFSISFCVFRVNWPVLYISVDATCWPHFSFSLQTVERRRALPCPVLLWMLRLIPDRPQAAVPAPLCHPCLLLTPVALGRPLFPQQHVSTLHFFFFLFAYFPNESLGKTAVVVFTNCSFQSIYIS